MCIHVSFLQIVDNAEAQYLAFFAGKTIGMIRAPDSYVFPAPFNIVEIFLVAPFECVILALSSVYYLLFIFTPGSFLCLD